MLQNKKIKQFTALFFNVPEVGVEPTSLTRHDFKSCAYTNSAIRAFFHLEAWGGIEPPYIPFAEECLTTWLPGHVISLTFLKKLSKYKNLW